MCEDLGSLTKNVIIGYGGSSTHSLALCQSAEWQLGIARGHCVSLKRKEEPPQTPGCGLGESMGGSVSYLGDCNYSKDFLTQKSNQDYSALNIFLF